MTECHDCNGMGLWADGRRCPTCLGTGSLEEAQPEPATASDEGSDDG